MSALTAASTTVDLCGSEEARRLAARILVVRSLPARTTEAACSKRPHNDASSFSETILLESQDSRVERSLESFFGGKEIVLFLRSKTIPKAVHFSEGGTT